MQKTEIKCKVSFHEGKKFSQRHNTERASGNWNKDGHINPELINENVILVHKPLREFFVETFSEAIEDFNQMNMKTHPERMTSVSTYYQKYKSHARETIIQLGDEEEFQHLAEAVGIRQARQIHRQFLTACVDYWLSENQNLRIFGAYLHFDEKVPHLHLDYLPVSESERGMKLKVSLNNTLAKYQKQTGFKRDEEGNIVRDESGNAIEVELYAERRWVQWEKETRNNLERIAAEVQLTEEQKKQIDFEIIQHEPKSKNHDDKWQWEEKAVKYFIENPEPPEVPKRPRKKDYLEGKVPETRFKFRKEEREEIYQEKASQYKSARANLKLWEKGKELTEQKQYGLLQQIEEQLERERQQLQIDRQQMEQKLQADRNQMKEEYAEKEEKLYQDYSQKNMQLQTYARQIQKRERQLDAEVENRVKHDDRHIRQMEREAAVLEVFGRYLPEQKPTPDLYIKSEQERREYE